MRFFAPLVLGIVLAAAACGGAGSGAAGQAAPATTIAVSMLDNAIKLDAPSAAAGKITFSVKNMGSVAHSLVVLKINLDESKIPASAQDPSKVDERGSVGSLGQLQPSQSKDLTLDLAAGKYVLICNEPGHYLSGMHTSFTVK
jgi:uncharacterized cupredoxin-like copper-binding protein